jgi:hypothetical protein
VLIGSTDTRRRSQPNSDLAQDRAEAVQREMRAPDLPPVLIVNSAELPFARLITGPNEQPTGREVRICLAYTR